MAEQEQVAPVAATARNALVVIAVVVAGAAIYWLSGILTPLALALFLMIMIDSFARVLRRRLRFPAIAAMPLAIVISVVLFCLAAFVVASNAGGFIGALYSYEPKLDGMIARLASVFGLAVPPTVAQLIQQLNPAAYVGSIAQAVEGFASSTFLVMIYLGFLLASRQGFERKMVSLFRHPGERHNAAVVFLRIRNGIEGYLWVQTVACAIIGLGSWAVMAALGLNNALFWAFLIFIVGYIPIIGGLVGVAAPTLFALVQFDEWWRTVVMVVALQTIGFVVGSIVYPRMQGKSLNIDPVVVLLALAFWGVVWGVPGMILSTPLTVVMMVVLAQFAGTHWIAVLLSSDGEPLGSGRTAPPPAHLEAPPASPVAAVTHS
ncbi:MAG TPA: AI-2E family transporter [Caulobacteraceae bacterium]|jgi:predicted PurR-regulated permease PerM|nr:AI-2E family transporter [Caulobacteraceae bacterium]